ncbi:MAG: hypothetical protein U1E32_05990 [Rhodoglobus sp.]|nr:hypothetical protein [Rhodoglobus sp.]
MRPSLRVAAVVVIVRHIAGLLQEIRVVGVDRGANGFVPLGWRLRVDVVVEYRALLFEEIGLGYGVVEVVAVEGVVTIIRAVLIVDLAGLVQVVHCACSSVFVRTGSMLVGGTSSTMRLVGEIAKGLAVRMSPR